MLQPCWHLIILIFNNYLQHQLLNIIKDQEKEKKKSELWETKSKSTTNKVVR